MCSKQSDLWKKYEITLNVIAGADIHLVISTAEPDYRNPYYPMFHIIGNESLTHEHTVPNSLIVNGVPSA